MDIKIIVATHKKYWMSEDDVYLPVHVGREGKADIGYIGLCYYRRYFTRSNPRNCAKKKAAILSKKEYEEILQTIPIIVPDKRRYYIETMRSHYNHSHYAKDLDMTEIVLKELYPEYGVAFDEVMNHTWAHMFNMFVMRRDYFDDYCKWMFTIFVEVEKRTDISGYNAVEARIFGYLSELLLDVWLEANRYEYHEQNVSFLEPQNWLKKGGIFLKRKICGSL